MNFALVTATLLLYFIGIIVITPEHLGISPLSASESLNASSFPGVFVHSHNTFFTFILVSMQ